MRSSSHILLPIRFFASVICVSCSEFTQFDPCAAYKWGVAGGVKAFASTTTEDLVRECNVCPDDISSGDVSATEAAERGIRAVCSLKSVKSSDCDSLVQSFISELRDSSPADVAGVCPEVNDSDADGVAFGLDCDDSDVLLQSKEWDQDCDGATFDNDCDDSDAESTVLADDADCDGTPAAEDCDDYSSTSTTKSQDQDCDTVPLGEDCDDGDSSLLSKTQDADCDGLLTEADCDDSDSLSTSVAEDHDCDGTLTFDDCDDADPTLGAQMVDQDCDGASTSVDCDDFDPSLGDSVYDGDCDGVMTSLDCNDSDSAVNPGATEVCGDGIDNDCDGKGCLASSSLSMSLEWSGEASGDASGFSIGGGCDFNADNYDDLMVGAYLNDDGGSNAGAAYLIMGNDYSSLTTSSSKLSSYFKFEGERFDDYAGFSVACVGDVNNDSFDDFMVGAYSQVGPSFDNSGAAYLILGNGTPGSYALGSAIKYQGQDSEWAGRAVGSGGDVNSDGYQDMIIGATANNDGGIAAGAAYLVLGSSSPSSANLSTKIEFVGGDKGDLAGSSVAGDGDVNGDGFGDLLIGAPGHGSYDYGAAFLVLGESDPVSTTLATCYKYDVSGAAWNAGTSVAISGDANGDGYSDLFVGVPGSGSYGEADLILGSARTGSASLTSGIRYSGAVSGEEAGISVAFVGDIDADGFDDLVVGASGSASSASNTGSAYFILGNSTPSSSTLTSLTQFAGETVGDQAGYAVGAAGDVDGDGNDDILIGGPGNDDSYTNAGASYLVFGIGL